ncbi:ATP-dependent RNA helicase RhlE [Desulfuromusa kysingii]|uniref:DEAD-box ATP-dependent RNA helicase RhpA n=1 Tax=Desulfuromusa kysingii TaxID=37625 RepID=A0A1H3ZI44_9BACT|nr:DEAD/DEAH box helicase [Desulfuromusa kysingii]SEA23370.1 ATP-dependent RNA helicase RhlE [Desulfuromusa kysingii]
MFSTFGFSESILKAIAAQGYVEPTPIQKKVIPTILHGRDLMATASTGTGKTAGFILPLLQRLSTGPKAKANHVRVLVLTPTRELAQQVADNVAAYSCFMSLKTAVVYGGVKINPQMMRMCKGVDLLVATPGRLLDLHAQNALRLTAVETLVLDEADRMLDMGFRDQLKAILKLLPNQRQNLLFSATFSAEIRALGQTFFNQPQLIDVSPKNSTAIGVQQWVYEVDKKKKAQLLSYLISRNDWSSILVFTKTKKGADALVHHLKNDNLSAAAIHGDKSQGVRARVLSAFKQNKVRILVATDIAARGLDINGLPLVVNFDLPKVAEDYIHRVGRTGRAGLTGQGISLVSADEVNQLAVIESLLNRTLTREVEAGFVPTHKVPLTRPTKLKPKKPKKIKAKRGQPQEGDWQKKDRSKSSKPASRGRRR